MIDSDRWVVAAARRHFDNRFRANLLEPSRWVTVSSAAQLSTGRFARVTRRTPSSSLPARLPRSSLPDGTTVGPSMATLTSASSSMSAITSPACCTEANSTNDSKVSIGNPGTMCSSRFSTSATTATSTSAGRSASANASSAANSSIPAVRNCSPTKPIPTRPTRQTPMRTLTTQPLTQTRQTRRTPRSGRYQR